MAELCSVFGKAPGIFLTSLWADGYLGCFDLLPVFNSVATDRAEPADISVLFSFPSYACLPVGLLDRWAAPFLILFVCAGNRI